jgi:hypothetical protein
LVISQKYDCPRNAELLSEVARGGEPVTGRESAGKNGLPQAEVDLPKERLTLPRKWYHELHRKRTF